MARWYGHMLQIRQGGRVGGHVPQARLEGGRVLRARLETGACCRHGGRTDACCRHGGGTGAGVAGVRPSNGGQGRTVRHTGGRCGQITGVEADACTTMATCIGIVGPSGDHARKRGRPRAGGRRERLLSTGKKEERKQANGRFQE